MPKPDTIDRHKCHGKDKEEKYKDLTALDFWWGLRELAADFDVNNYQAINGEELSPRQYNEIAYIQLLHYTVEVKLSGAFYQMELMEKLFDSPMDQSSSLDLRVFEAKEAFDATHEDMYQACCAISNQLFMLLNRRKYEPVKYDRNKPISMSPSDLRYWLKINNHKDIKSLSRMLTDCDDQLDMRHHATHYGAVPVYANISTGVLYVQSDFKIGEFLSKYDIVKHIKSGGKMSTLLEVSKPRAINLCGYINKIYRYIYAFQVFEKYMVEKGLKLKEDYHPYWDKP